MRRTWGVTVIPIVLLLAASADAFVAESEEELLLRLDGNLDVRTLDDVVPKLGQLQSAKGLEKLLTRNHPEEVFRYASFMGFSVPASNELPKDVEEVIVRNFAEHTDSVAQLVSVSRKKYRSRILFDDFVAALKPPDLLPSQRSQIAGALVQTDLSVEAEVLDLLKHVSRKSKAAQAAEADKQMRGSFYGFLGNRHYPAAVPVIREALSLSPREAHVARDNPHLVIEADGACRALVQIGTPDAQTAVVKYIEALRSDGAHERAKRTIAWSILQTLSELPADAPVDFAFIHARTSRPTDGGVLRAAHPYPP